MKKHTTTTPIRTRRKPLITALEPRILLDGAAVVTMAEMATDVAFESDAVHNQGAEQSVHFAAPAPVAAESNHRREVAFVDTSVNDYQSLVDGLGDGIEVILINGNDNGLEQMVASLQGQSGIDAIHLFSHGSVGELKLGTLTLNADSVQANAELLSTLGASLTETGDLMLYGCFVGADSEGQSFIDSIASLTLADVAASEDLTGAEGLGGNWVLEAGSGSIEAQSQVIAGFERSLLISGWADKSYTEQQGEIALGNGITITGGDNFGTGYVQFEVTAGKQAEDVLRLNSATNATVKDAVSVQGNNVFIGMGAGQSLLKIGTIDNYYNGKDGRALRINFDNATIPGNSPVVNGDFSKPFNEGWNAYTGAINLGVTTIRLSNGKVVTLPELAQQYYPNQTPGRDDNDLTSGYDKGVVEISGGKLKLEEADIRTPRYGVVHGPAAHSDVFAAEKGTVLKFDWQANSIADDYHVAAFLVNATTGQAELIFSDWGTTGSGTEFISVSAAGNYSFIFVSGTFDKTGGTVAGASMFIDNIRVEKAAITPTVLSNLALQVLYKNTSDNPTTAKVVTLTTKDITAQVDSKSINLTVTPVNDPSALAGNAQLPSIFEDQASNDGRTLEQLYGGVFSDIDNRDTFGGVFITNNPLAGDVSKGTWQYRVAGSSTWRDVGSVSSTDALLLAANTHIRFNPATDYNGTPASLSLKGVDQTLAGLNATSDTTQARFNTTTASASSGLSALERTLSINVISVNDIPVFNNLPNSTQLTETSGVNASVNDLTVSGVLTGQLSVSDIETLAGNLILSIRGGSQTSPGVWQLTGRYGTLELDTTNNNTWTYTPNKWDAINALRADQSVTDLFQFKVSDPDGGIAVQDFTINLKGENDTPLVAKPLTEQNFKGDGSWSWQVPANSFTDAEGTGLIYSAWVTHVAGVPVVTPYQLTGTMTTDGNATDWLTFDAGSRTLNGDPTASWANQALTIEIRANDGVAEATSAFTLTLDDTANNQAPLVVNEMNWTSIDAKGTDWELQIPVGTFSDSDSPDGLSYTAFIVDPVTGIQTLIDGTFGLGLVFDSTNVKLTGDGSVQNVIVKIVATDDKQTGYSQKSAETQFQLHVNDSTVETPTTTVTANSSSVTGLLIDGAGSGRYTLPANAFTIQAAAGSTVSYAAQLSGGGSLPTWLTFDTASGTFSGNPPHATNNLSIEVTATVNDGGSPVTSEALALTLQVANPNDAIVLKTAPLADKTVAAGTELGLSFAAPFTDPDGAISGYATNAGVPRVDGIDYVAVIVDESGNEKPAADFGLTLAQDGTGNLTLNGNPPGGVAYLNILIRGTEVDGGTTQTTSFTLFLNDAKAASGDDVGAYTANNAGETTISGEAKQGERLTAATTDANGLNNSTPSYQWQVSSDNGATWQDIARSEAQTASLKMTQAEAGKQVRVQSFYTDDSGVVENPVSTAVAVADVNDGGNISVQGSPLIDSILSSTLEDPDGLTTANPTYQWQVSSDGGVSWSNITAANFSTFQLTAKQGGKQVRVQANYTDDMGNTATVTSGSVTVQLGEVAPVAVDDNVSITEAGGVANATPISSPVSGNVLSNDSDQNTGDTLTITKLRSGVLEGFGNEATESGSSFTLTGIYGQIVMDSAGNYTYTLNEDNAKVQALAVGETLTETFNYTVVDKTSLFDTALLTITIKGSNDAPEVTIGPVDDLFESTDQGVQSVQTQGVIGFSDLDSNDTVSITYASKDDIAWSKGALNSDLKSKLVAGFSILETGRFEAPGVVNWTYSVADVNLDFLAKGETLTFSYTITATDIQGATATTTVRFTITGTNDAPTISAEAADGITEVAGNSSAQDLSDSGVVNFGDLDTTDTVSITYASKNDIAWSGGTLDATLAASLVAGFSITETGRFEAPGVVNWTYNVADVNLDFLAEGETLTFSYTITATDIQGATATTTVGFTITGTNDAPTISAEAADGITEVAGNSSAQDLSDSGVVNFGDLDTTDTVSITYASKNDIAWSKGTLSDELKSKLVAGFTIPATTDAEAPGSVDWAYNVADVNLDFLAEGETLTFSYTITATDSQGATATDTVSFTITGTNDAPTLTADAAKAITEVSGNSSTQKLSDTGVVSFGDLDVTDTVSITYASKNDIAWSKGTLSDELKSKLVAGFTIPATTDAEAPGSVDWAYNVNSINLDFLAKGETLTFSYTITATDSQGATATDTVSFTITGTNDAPVLQIAEPAVFTEGSDAAQQSLIQSGDVKFEDLDVNDKIAITAKANNDIAWQRNDTTLVGSLPSDLINTLIGGFSTGAQDQPHIGEIVWTYNASALDLDFLNAGDTITFSYTVTVTDSQDATASQVVTIRLLGTNDAPELTAYVLTKAETIVQQGADYKLDAAQLFSDKDSTLSREDLDFNITGLPAGLRYNPETGVISGKSTESGKFQVTVTATDAEGASISRTYELLVTAVVQGDTPAVPKDTTPISAPNVQPQQIKITVSDMPSGLLSNSVAQGAISDSSGYMASSSFAGSESLTFDSTLSSTQGEPLDAGMKKVGATEQVILSERGALVIQTQNPDGKTSVRASVDVSVMRDGVVVFTDVQREAFSSVALAVVSIERTADKVLTVTIQDTRQTGSSQVYTGSLSNGESLPSWIKLDPNTGTLTLSNRPAGQKEVSVRIQTIGSDGQARVLELNLDLDELFEGSSLVTDPALIETEGQEPIGFVPLSDQLEAELTAHNNYGDRLMALLQSA